LLHFFQTSVRFDLAVSPGFSTLRYISARRNGRDSGEIAFVFRGSYETAYRVYLAGVGCCGRSTSLGPTRIESFVPRSPVARVRGKSISTGQRRRASAMSYAIPRRPKQDGEFGAAHKVFLIRSLARWADDIGLSRAALGLIGLHCRHQRGLQGRRIRASAAVPVPHAPLRANFRVQIGSRRFFEIDS